MGLSHTHGRPNVLDSCRAGMVTGVSIVDSNQHLVVHGCWNSPHRKHMGSSHPELVVAGPLLLLEPSAVSNQRLVVHCCWNSPHRRHMGSAHLELVVAGPLLLLAVGFVE